MITGLNWTETLVDWCNSLEEVKSLVRSAFWRTESLRAADLDLPQEEVFAVAMHTHRSFAHGLTFPSLLPELHRSFVMVDAPEAEVQAWRRAYMHVVRKATYMHGGKRVVQKATPNLARIPQIMDMFPGAYFVHIIRDPYEVYPSWMHMLTTLIKSYRMEDCDFDEIEAWAVDMYKSVMNKYMADRSLIPEDRFVEIRFEDLRRDPIGQIESIYRQFGLDWEKAHPSIEQYLQTLRAYKQNSYAPDPRVRKQVDTHWKFVADAWDYS